MSKRKKAAPPAPRTRTITQARDPYRDELIRAGKLGEEGKHDEAEAIWRTYLESCPDDPDVCFNVGVCIMRRADSPALRFEAAQFFERVVQSPHAEIERKADAMNNMGLMMERCGETEKAATAYAFALKMFPAHKAARVNLGDAKRFMGDFAGARGEYDAVLDQDPESPEAHFCAGMIALLFGEWERGWREYRWRYKAPSFKSKPFASEAPPWEGEPLDGKTLLIVAEQGWGDQIMFARYAQELKRRWPSCSVWYHCDPVMHALLSGVYGVDRVVFNPTDGFDYVSPVMDLPHCTGMKSEADIPPAHCIRTMPSWSPWSLQVGNVLRKRVALVWAGSPMHGKDKARSIHARLYQPLIDAHPECDFFSLQCGPAQPEVAELRGVTDLAPEVKDWTDTAQMLACMDLLVSVDTACVHLAGAMGTPAWMLCPTSPDFRWQLTREDSPWYGKMRLFRQTDRNDWQTPIQRITDALTTF
ncbi:hypothetical protein LBMAG57_37490 [Verrucomicrobiota bacterium]|nr:hypothetical protein LBMAG57_37490 [Verrucomicrobiota bacterium]